MRIIKIIVKITCNRKLSGRRWGNLLVLINV